MISVNPSPDVAPQSESEHPSPDVRSHSLKARAGGGELVAPMLPPWDLSRTTQGPPDATRFSGPASRYRLPDRTSEDWSDSQR